MLRMQLLDWWEWVVAYTLVVVHKKLQLFVFYYQIFSHNPFAQIQQLHA